MICGFKPKFPTHPDWHSRACFCLISAICSSTRSPSSFAAFLSICLFVLNVLATSSDVRFWHNWEWNYHDNTKEGIWISFGHSYILLVSHPNLNFRRFWLQQIPLLTRSVNSTWNKIAKNERMTWLQATDSQHTCVDLEVTPSSWLVTSSGHMCL